MIEVDGVHYLLKEVRSVAEQRQERRFRPFERPIVWYRHGKLQCNVFLHTLRSIIVPRGSNNGVNAALHRWWKECAAR